MQTPGLRPDLEILCQDGKWVFIHPQLTGVQSFGCHQQKWQCFKTSVSV